MRDSDVLDNNPHVALSALETMHGQVYGWALSRCGYEHAAAEDLMQQAYVELLSGNARFDNKCSLKTFVFAVVQNLASDHFRRLGTRLRLLRQHAELAVTDAPDMAELADSEHREQVWSAVKALPARQRDLIELVFCRDLTIDEASRVMGVSVGTGRVHYDRAKKALRARLQRCWLEQT
jgi:RNA polymerase sigma-70 factor (ECF subfamily)